MARKSGFVRRHGVMRRETSWVGVAGTSTALASAGTAVLFTGFGATVLALRPFTIVRTRGFFTIRSDQTAATEDYGAALGAAVVSEQALAIGVTAVPTPIADQESDLFFLYERLGASLVVADATGIDSTKSMSFDSKAMRRVEEGSDVAMSVESDAFSAGVQCLKGGRILIKLH